MARGEGNGAVDARRGGSEIEGQLLGTLPTMDVGWVLVPVDTMDKPPLVSAPVLYYSLPGGHIMLKTIIRNSPALLAFIATLQIALTKPQRQHVLNVVDSLIVGETNLSIVAWIENRTCGKMLDFLSDL
jgi:hypothetical protein